LSQPPIPTARCTLPTRLIDHEETCSHFVLIGVETLGEAWNLSWPIHMRCLDDGMRGLKHKRECDYRAELDMETLVCTRGRDFPLAWLASRLRCQRCGCRRVSVMFGPPSSYGALTMSSK
jgi:hypothetical protein